MGWAGLILVTDADLGNLEPEATHSSKPWGAATWPKARAEAKRDLKIWLERDFARHALASKSRSGLALPAIADRVLDRWSPDLVFGYTGSAYSDITTAARDDTPDDVNLSTVFTTVGADRLYVGALWEFEGLFLKLLETLNANASVLTAKYWSPTGWASLGLGDGTSVSGATLAQSGRVMWSAQPTNWERRRLNGTAEEYFWVELSVSAALTAGVLASQILPIRAPDGLKRVAAFLALAHIFRALAAGAAEPASWLERVSNQARTGYQDRAEDLYASLRDNGGIPLDLNLSDAVEPTERQVSAPLRMLRG